jgi:hypothetical protein
MRCTSKATKADVWPRGPLFVSPDRNVVWRIWLTSLTNMTYSHSTVIPHEPPENVNEITDHDASQQRFDVYEAYQSALSDEQVSPNVALMQPEARSHPDIQISPPVAAILSLTELITCSDGKFTHSRAFRDASCHRHSRHNVRARPRAQRRC